jgi:hypothetical protein
VVRRALLGIGAALLLAVPARAADPAAASVPVLTGKPLASFCTGLAGVIAAEAERERSDFSASLAQAVDAARKGLDKRMALAAAIDDEGEGAPPLTWEPEDALAAGRYLWQRWMPTSPAADLTVVEDRPGEWLVGPAPTPEAPYTGEPIHVAKADGAVTWKLPHPSERERLYATLCGEKAGE